MRTNVSSASSQALLCAVGLPPAPRARSPSLVQGTGVHGQLPAYTNQQSTKNVPSLVKASKTCGQLAIWGSLVQTEPPPNHLPYQSPPCGWWWFYLFIFKIFIYLFMLCQVLVAACGLLSCGMQTLSCSMHVGSSSPTRDRTRAPCIGSMECYPLHHQGRPGWWWFYLTQSLFSYCRQHSKTSNCRCLFGSKDAEHAVLRDKPRDTTTITSSQHLFTRLSSGPLPRQWHFRLLVGHYSGI